MPAVLCMTHCFGPAINCWCRYQTCHRNSRRISAPKGTPADKVAHWGAVFKQAAADQAIIDSLGRKGTTVAFKNPAESKQYWSSTFELWKGIATKVGMYKGG